MGGGMRPQGLGGKRSINTIFYANINTRAVYRAGSGFKLHVKNLRTLVLNLGPHTTTPFAAVGVSINYQDFFTVNASAGVNHIPLAASSLHNKGNTNVIRINVEGWQNNRINLQSITLNAVYSFLHLKKHVNFECM